eukprot:11198449-Lingulodinium_polyedra.AAC.1
MLCVMTDSWHRLVAACGMRVDLPDCGWSATVDCAGPMKLKDPFTDVVEVSLDFTPREKGFEALGCQIAFNNDATAELQR